MGAKVDVWPCRAREPPHAAGGGKGSASSSVHVVWRRRDGPVRGRERIGSGMVSAPLAGAGKLMVRSRQSMSRIWRLSSGSHTHGNPSRLSAEGTPPPPDGDCFPTTKPADDARGDQRFRRCALSFTQCFSTKQVREHPNAQCNDAGQRMHDVYVRGDGRSRQRPGRPGWTPPKPSLNLAKPPLRTILNVMVVDLSGAVRPRGLSQLLTPDRTINDMPVKDSSGRVTGSRGHGVAASATRLFV
jgi:hypothetical protein